MPGCLFACFKVAGRWQIEEVKGLGGCRKSGSILLRLIVLVWAWKGGGVQRGVKAPRNRRSSAWETELRSMTGWSKGPAAYRFREGKDHGIGGRFLKVLEPSNPNSGVLAVAGVAGTGPGVSRSGKGLDPAAKLDFSSFLWARLAVFEAK